MVDFDCYGLSFILNLDEKSQVLRAVSLPLIPVRCVVLFNKVHIFVIFFSIAHWRFVLSLQDQNGNIGNYYGASIKKTVVVTTGII